MNEKSKQNKTINAENTQNNNNTTKKRPFRKLGLALLTATALTATALGTVACNGDKPSDAVLIDAGDSGQVEDTGPTNDGGPTDTEEVDCSEVNGTSYEYYTFTNPEGEELTVKQGDVVVWNGDNYIASEYVQDEGKVILRKADDDGEVLEGGVELLITAEYMEDNPNYTRRAVVTLSTNEGTHAHLFEEGEERRVNNENTVVRYLGVTADGRAELEVTHSDEDSFVVYNDVLELGEMEYSAPVEGLTVEVNAIGEDVSGNYCYRLFGEFTVVVGTNGFQYDATVKQNDSWTVVPGEGENEGISIQLIKVVLSLGQNDYAWLTAKDDQEQATMLVPVGQAVSLMSNGTLHTVVFNDANKEVVETETSDTADAGN